MDAVTYPNPKVAAFLNAHMIVVRVPHDAQPLATNFKVHSTPTLVTLDSEGKEHHRLLGFQPPDGLIAGLLLGIGRVHYDRERFAEALAVLEELLAGYPGSDSVPEAIFLRGMSLYKILHNPGPLKEAYEKLQTGHPSSEWTMRARRYRLL